MAVLERSRYKIGNGGDDGADVPIVNTPSNSDHNPLLYQYVPFAVGESLKEGNLEKNGLDIGKLIDSMRFGANLRYFEPITSTGTLEIALYKALAKQGKVGVELIGAVQAVTKPTRDYLKLIRN